MPGRFLFGTCAGESYCQDQRKHRRGVSAEPVRCPLSVWSDASAMPGYAVAVMRWPRRITALHMRGRLKERITSLTTIGPGGASATTPGGLSCNGAAQGRMT